MHMLDEDEYSKIYFPFFKNMKENGVGFVI
jgi:hypothetical protein